MQLRLRKRHVGTRRIPRALDLLGVLASSSARGPLVPLPRPPPEAHLYLRRPEAQRFPRLVVGQRPPCHALSPDGLQYIYPALVATCTFVRIRRTGSGRWHFFVIFLARLCIPRPEALHPRKQCAWLSPCAHLLLQGRSCREKTEITVTGRVAAHARPIWFALSPMDECPRNAEEVGRKDDVDLVKRQAAMGANP